MPVIVSIKVQLFYFALLTGSGNSSHKPARCIPVTVT
jgi:hypothetical protein